MTKDKIFFILIFIILAVGSLAFYKKPTTKKPIIFPTDLAILPVKGEYSYANTTNSFNSYFKDDFTKNESISFENENGQIKFFTPAIQSFGNLNKGQVFTDKNTITYKDIFENMDLRYTVSTSRLLEEFIITDAKTALKINKISQQVITSQEYKQKETGEIEFYKNKKEIAFTLPQPVIYELNNPDNKNYGIKYQIEKENNNLVISKIITPEGQAWLKNPNRQYPIAIDLVIDNADTSANWVSSDATNLKTSQETSIKHEGTGSIKLDALSYAGDGADGSFPNFIVSTGDGADGALSPTGSFDLNTSTSGSRSYADGIAYKVASNPTGTTIVTSNTVNGITAGDEILLINLQGTSSDRADVGVYEFLQVQSVGTTHITTTTSIVNSYDGTTFSNQKVVVQRVPNYTSVTLDSTDILTANSWDGLSTAPTGTAGYYTGIIAFRATGTVSVGSSASIDVTGKGYRGGSGYVSTGGQNGESYDGFVGAGGNNQSVGTSGGGTGNYNGSTSPSGARGGGGGGGADTAMQSDDGGGGGGGGGYASGGGGGGGGADCSVGGGNGGIGGTSPSITAGGGGGGSNSCGATGTGGSGGTAGAYGTNGTGTYPGTGGSVGPANATGYGGSSNTSAGAGVGAGGAGGGGAYGSADLSTIFFGSGGGAGGGDNGSTAAPSGGNGGGIILISANTLSNSGTISSNGNNGTDAASAGNGGSGGGAGGSIKIEANTATLGTSLVTATGGAASAKSATAGGGGGGSIGRIKIINNSSLNNYIFDLNTSTSGSRSYADGIAYKVASNPTGTTIVTSNTVNGIAAGDEILLINLQGTSSDRADVGVYEFLQVQSVGTTHITTTTSIVNSYDGTTFSNQKVIVQRVPNYTSVTLSTGSTMTATNWDTLTTTPNSSHGYYTGIVAFRATGTVSVGSSASIDVTGKGYRGGAGYSAAGGQNGESYDGFVGAGGNNQSIGSSGGGTGNYNGSTSPSGARGGGGGGGADTAMQSDDGGGGGGGGGYASGGGGGGGGADCSVGGGNGGIGGTSPSITAGGGGGGSNSCGATGTGGSGGTAGAYGTNGTGTYPGTGGSVGPANATGYGGSSNTSAGAGVGAGGAGGGGAYGSADLSTIFFGSGGGAGGGTAYVSPSGGNGGGIILISANTLSNSGTISSNGNNGTAGTVNAGSSGGGAGGSIKIEANTTTLGTSLVTATGGAASAKSATAGGGGGGSIGRIRVESTTKSGTTSPTYSGDNTPFYSLNDTATLTSTSTDLSQQDNITFWVRSNRTGQISRFQFGESSSDEQTYDITINSANTWEQKTFNIGSISSTSRDAVTKYAFKIINQDQNFIFYFDDIQTTVNSPNTPSLDSPTNGATNQSSLPTLKTTTTDVDSDYLRYKIELCTNSSMTTNCQTFDQTSSQTGWSGQNTQTSTAYTSGTQASYTLQTSLNVNTTYYWRSYAIDPAGTNRWSSTQSTPYSFTTASPPSTPSLDSPTNSATNQSFLPSLKTTATDANSDYLRYKIELCTNSSMTTNCQTFNQTSSQTGWSGQNTQTSTAYTSGTQATYTIQTSLNTGTTYYWRSYAIDPGGSNTWSSTQSTPYSFTTMSAPNSANQCFASETPNDSQINIIWTDNATNENGYMVQRSVNGGAWTDLQNYAANTTSHTDSTVSSNNTYQYRIAPYFTGPIYSDWCYTFPLNLGQGDFGLEGLELDNLILN